MHVFHYAYCTDTKQGKKYGTFGKPRHAARALARRNVKPTSPGIESFTAGILASPAQT